MSKAKFEAARELIQAKQYDAARAVLKTIDHPQASDWLTKLDKIAPIKPIDDDDPFGPVISSVKPKKRRLPAWVAIILLVILLTIGVFAWSYYKSTVDAAEQNLDQAVKDLDYKYTYCPTYCGAINGGQVCIDDCLKTPAALLRQRSK